MIHFDVEEWSCTDPDEFQFCRKVNDTTFEYIQLRDGYFKMLAEEKHVTGKKLLEEFNDKTSDYDWDKDEIDVGDYSKEEANEYLSPYGGVLDNVTDEVLRNQILAECIFETDIVGFDFDY